MKLCVCLVGGLGGLHWVQMFVVSAVELAFAVALKSVVAIVCGSSTEVFFMNGEIPEMG